MTTWLLVLLAIGATARLTRLVTADFVTRRLRAAIQRRWGRESAAAYFVTCDYCLSVWTGTAVATVVTIWPDNRAVHAALVALTASMFAGLVTRLDA